MLILDLFHSVIDGKLCLFMTKYSSTLQQIIEKKKKTGQVFSEIEICNIVKKILCGIQFLHKNNIIHRDIKVCILFYLSLVLN